MTVLKEAAPSQGGAAWGSAVDSARTVLDLLAEAIQAAASFNQHDQTPPAAVLWPDGDRQWEALQPALRQRLPLFTLGPYAPAERIGPAYWLRCVADRTLPDLGLAPGETPVLYLPGYSRQDVRAVESCPKALQPLAELQYRGVLWAQKNGRDWTIAAFLQNADGGLGLNVGADSATRAALQTALVKLAEEPVERLHREGLIRAPFLNALLHPDDVKNVLRWLDDPRGFAAGCDAASWAAFVGLCQAKYGFHPDTDGLVAAARRLAQRDGAWDLAWRRFAEAPSAYVALPSVLKQAKPARTSPLFERGSYPQDNETAEAELRQELLGLVGVDPTSARRQVQALEAAHAARREWVWAKLGQAPLAMALGQLAEVAGIIAGGGPGGTHAATPAALIEDYVTRGWRADAAVLRALAAVEAAGDVGAVHAAVRAVYSDWLDASAAAFQTTVRRGVPSAYDASPPPTLAPRTCLLFSDGLRFDVARRLADGLEGRGLACDVGWRLAALPTVTATAKPAVSPVASLLTGGPALEPIYAADGQAKVNVQVLRRALATAGHQVLLGDDLGDPAGTAWTELGDIDSYGHEQGWKVAHHLERALRALQGRIVALLDHGWTRVVVVTDHGWLLLPGGLPKADLPEHLTEVRKGRCARMKPFSTTDHLTVAWHWDAEVFFALAPGSACFEAGKEYEHGGLSPQECVTPVLTVSRPAVAASTVSTQSVTWKGLRCVIGLAGATPGVQVDVRTKAADAGTSLAAGGLPKAVSAEGSTSLVVPDDDRLGDAALVVVLAADGTVLTYVPTTVGG